MQEAEFCPTNKVGRVMVSGCGDTGIETIQNGMQGDRGLKLSGSAMRDCKGIEYT